MAATFLVQLLVAGLVSSGGSHASEASAAQGTCALQTKMEPPALSLAHEDGQTTRKKATLTARCKFEILDMDFFEPGDDGFEYMVCHDLDLKTTHFLRDDNVTQELECGDQVTVVLEETEAETRGQHTPPWEIENKPFYRVEEIKEKVPTSLLEKQRREKYGLSEHVNREHKEMDILMIACNYDDYQVHYTEDIMDALYVDNEGGLSYTDGLNLSSLGRLSAPRSRGRFVNVSMGKTLASVVGGEDGTGCPWNDCYDTALAKIQEQHPDVDPDSYTFREFFMPRQIGSCGWAGIANVGCGRFSKLPNPGGCWAMNLYAGAGIRSHELGHNQGIIHPQAFKFKEAYKQSKADQQEVMFGPHSWNKLELWQMHVLRDELPDVFTWGIANTTPAIITLGSMSLPFEETGAEASAVRIPCTCCRPLLDPKSEDYGGLDYWLQYRGRTGRFDGDPYYTGKIMVHNGHKHRGNGEFWAVLSPGETYNPPFSPIYIHFCPNGTEDARASVSMAYSQEEAKATCPGAALATEQIIERTIEAEPELGFPGLLCDFPVSHEGRVHNDCFEREGQDGTWCVSGRLLPQPRPDINYNCNESYDSDGTDYRGCQSVTKLGFTCQRWDSQSPHRHRFYPGVYPKAGLEDNYCRNPDGEPSIWCYTSDERRRWDYCAPLDLGPKYLTCASAKTEYYPSCSVTNGSSISSTYPCQCGNVQCTSGRKCTAATSSCRDYCDETYSGDGRDYAGCQTKTRSGRTCQRWDSNVPHSHRFRGESSSMNFCRNPDGEPSIWCYTTDPKTRWEFCDPLPGGVELLKPADPKSPDTCWPVLSPASGPLTTAAPAGGGGVITSSTTAAATTPPATKAATTTTTTTTATTTSPTTTAATTTTSTIDAGQCDEALSGKGADYRGCQTVTRSGYTCQRWDSQSPHRHSRTPTNYPNSGLEDNYCRNPDGEPSIWCYTTSSRRWEYCDPLPSAGAATTTTTTKAAGNCDEAMSGNGAGYRGCQTVTRSGDTCQRWDSQSPHRHSRTPTNYPNSGLEDNYCRNPDGEPSIWCYTTSSKRWDYCDPLPSAGDMPTTTD
eukprot:TRINITY_DN9495_c0_g1_i2.p1 TRINITY_DN9495_c0_g1~~TRINITY_DN9495_c0_g1_i2.p1  ORF type:complete len:1067 (+),score=138.55 TRINITY_DN9495_c0_g1_i2:87-3287(+)